MQVDKHFGENVLLSMEKLIKYVCIKGKFCAYGGGSHKSSQASFYYISLDDRKFGSFLCSLITLDNVHIQLNEL